MIIQQELNQKVIPKTINNLEILEIHLVNHCNLNCANCNHFSPLAEKWYIDINDFTNQLKLLVKNYPKISILRLLGGEPCLHPQVVQLCKIARQIMPIGTIIELITNGTIIQPIKEISNTIDDIHILITPYFTNNTWSGQEVENYDNVFFLPVRPIMRETLIDSEGKQNIEENFKQCSMYSGTCLTLKDYKIYLCPAAAHMEHYFKKIDKFFDINQIETLDIRSPISEKQLLQFSQTPNFACGFCKQWSQTTPYHKSYQDEIEFSKSLIELYFEDYLRYENIINNINIVNKIYTEKNFLIDKNYCPVQLRNIIMRSFGKIDIIIPHYNISNDLVDNLIKTLSNQTIIDDCVIYFVNDGYEDDTYLIQQLMTSKLNYVLLKNLNNQGPGASRNKGIQNSYNPYILFLDYDDKFINDTALEELYSKIHNNNIDLYTFLSWNNNYTGNQQQFIIKREYLIKQNIQYYPMYYYEDLLFYSEIILKTNKIMKINNTSNIYMEYNKENKLSLTALGSPKNPYIIFNFFIAQLLSILLILQNNNNEQSINILNANINDCLFILKENENNELEKIVKSMINILFHLYLLYSPSCLSQEYIDNYYDLNNIQDSFNNIILFIQDYKIYNNKFNKNILPIFEALLRDNSFQSFFYTTNNNAWVTFADNEDYLKCACALGLSLFNNNSIYPLIIMIPIGIFSNDQLDKAKLLTNNKNIIFKEMPYLLFNSSRSLDFNSTLNKFLTLTLTEFNKVCFIDSDILVKKNIDYLFEYNSPAFSFNEDKKISGELLLFKPDINLFSLIMNLTRHISFLSDEDMLEFLINNNFLKSPQYLKCRMHNHIFHDGGQPKIISKFLWEQISNINLQDIEYQNSIKKNQYFHPNLIYGDKYLSLIKNQIKN